ncbi:MAG: phosphonate ABC transporter, permease protein PhnE, partial [Pseudomonadota bacterium]
MTITTTDIQASYTAQLRLKRMWNGIGLALFILLLVAGFLTANDRNAGGFLQGLPNIFDFPADVVTEAVERADELPGFLLEYLPSLIETINIAAAATLIGAAVGGALAFLVTRGLAPIPWLVAPIRRLLDTLRAIPDIVIALVLIFVLGGGPVPAMIAIALHTMGALGKLFSEVAE